MRSQLEEYGVQFRSVRLQSSYVASLSVRFEVILSTSIDQQFSSLVGFSDYLSSDMFLEFAGYPVQNGSRGLMGISSARKFKYKSHISRSYF
jgi:hypothetical protein